MHTAPIESIIVENRQRKYHNPNAALLLEESIQANGIIQMPVCWKTDKGWKLIAGERRMKAIQILAGKGIAITACGQAVPLGHFPFLGYNSLKEATAYALELEENIKRTNLTWQEECAAVAELHKFRKATKENWTAADTAMEILSAQGEEVKSSTVTRLVTDSVLLTENLHRPEVANAKTQKDALKNVRQAMLEEFTAALGRKVETRSLTQTVLEVDAVQGLQMQPDESFDCIIMDPPYGVDADQFDAGLVVQHKYKDDWEYVKDLMTRVWEELTRVTKSQAHVYMFCDVRKFPFFYEILSDAQWDVWDRPLIWTKNGGHLPKPHFGPRLTYECILYANKGNKPVTGLYPDVLNYPMVTDKQHAAQKPADLYVDLLRRSTMPGNRICDPFCGSGTVFHAAKKLNLLAVGMDSDPFSVGLAKKVING